MRAVTIRAFGDPDGMDVVDRPAPAPAPGEVVISTEAIGVGGVDAVIRRGTLGGYGFAEGMIPGSEVAGIVTAVGEGTPPLELYFDVQSGLLSRMVRYAETPLGRNPTQIDYADYHVVDGVKIPYQWTVARPSGAFTVKIDKAEQNVPVDEKLFVAPPEPPPSAH